MPDILNVAIAGRFAAGKSTVSSQLIHLYGFERGSFAARLKQLAAEVYNDGNAIEKDGTYTVTDLDTGRDLDISGRQVLQRLGQSVKTLDRLFWVRWFAQDAAKATGPLVLDDLRFPYEADFLRSKGWLIVKVETPEHVRAERYRDLYGRYPTRDEMEHVSETSVDLIEPHMTVSGDGDAYATAAEIAVVSRSGIQDGGHVLSEFCWCSPTVEHVG